jgi:hypothetical protein
MRSLACARLCIAAFLAASSGCGSSSTGARADASGAKATFSVDLAPVRQLDMVFMIDNSDIAAKVQKMRDAFPRLLTLLKDPALGTYPDLRMAIIDSDLGTGGAYDSGSCGPNDRNGQSTYGDQGRFQMRGGTSCGVNTDALWLEYANGRAVNFNGSQDIGTVFGCLATNLGTGGCGYEHQLQAFEFALVTPGIGNEEQRKMLRPYAQLALVFITDEDDCSAAGIDGIFGTKPELAGESASLRCATLGHQCNGVNLTTVPPGFPTTAAFSAPFTSCAARMDACPNPTDSIPVPGAPAAADCSPLKSVKVMADELKGLKPFPDHQLLVAGIFGWPRTDDDIGLATYRIDLVPNPSSGDPAHLQVFDYWPVCNDSGNVPPNASFQSAWGWEATGGLRLAAFVDQFGSGGIKFSICERDFSSNMTTLGQALARRLGSSCLPAAVSQYARCTARLQIPDGLGGYTAQADPVPSCDADANAPLCYALTVDAAACSAGELKVEVMPASSVAKSTVLRFDCD